MGDATTEDGCKLLVSRLEQAVRQQDVASLRSILTSLHGAPCTMKHAASTGLGKMMGRLVKHADAATAAAAGSVKKAWQERIAAAKAAAAATAAPAAAAGTAPPPEEAARPAGAAASSGTWTAAVLPPGISTSQSKDRGPSGSRGGAGGGGGIGPAAHPTSTASRFGT